MLTIAWSTASDVSSFDHFSLTQDPDGTQQLNPTTQRDIFSYVSRYPYSSDMKRKYIQDKA